MNDIRLSIIIPYYNAEKYTNELLKRLNSQIREDIEVILIDDGSREPYKPAYDWVKLIRQKNGGASAARNTGLDNAVGEYIAFIDADDLVAENYVEKIIQKADKEHFDYCYISWKTIGLGWQQNVKLTQITDEFPPFNLCVWNRIYRRDMIGDVRFNTKKLIAEDAEFIRKVKEDGHKKAIISEYMYYYRSDTPDSLCKRFGKGELNTKRFVYHYPTITPDQEKSLLEEFKEVDKEGEIILMTNDYPKSLKEYAMILKPTVMQGTELRGVPTNLFRQIEPPLDTQVIIWTAETQAIGGIETFIYNFCMNMREYYDITVLYEKMDRKQLERLEPFVRVLKNRGQSITCDTLIVNRISDMPPSNVSYKHSVQMVHTCAMGIYKIPRYCDKMVFVSEAAAKSFGETDYQVIHNMTQPKKITKALLLVSATRLTWEKGQNRMIALADELTNAGIPFVWIYFTYTKLPTDNPNFIHMKPSLDISQYIKAADYLVQLSDHEAFCYSLVEAMEMGTPVITTPLTVLPEIGVKDGENGYVIPFDIRNSGYDYKKFIEAPLKGTFEYKYDNETLIKEWREVIGDMVPRHDYEPPKIKKISVRVKQRYHDVALGRILERGETLSMEEGRAHELNALKLVSLLA